MHLTLEGCAGYPLAGGGRHCCLVARVIETYPANPFTCPVTPTGYIMFLFTL